MPRKSSGEVSIAHEQHLFAFLRRGGGAIGVEINFARGRARAGRKSAGDCLRALEGIAIEDRREHLIELIGRHPHDRGFPVDEFLLHHVAGEFDCRHARCVCRCAFAA